MELDLHWSEKIPLIDGTDKGLIYILGNSSGISGKPGIYIFSREYNNQLIPLYVGQAKNLQNRIKQQIETNTRLMLGIKKARSGARYLIIGELKLKQGQNMKRSLGIIEASLIEHSLGNGFDILNKSGTKQLHHTINFTGNRTAKSLTGPLMKVKTR